MRELENQKKGISKEIDRRGFLSRLTALTGVVVAGSVVASCSHMGEGSIYTIDASKCTGCKDCFSSCQFNAISLSGNVAIISASRCAGCGKCVRQCDETAISVA